MQTKTETPGRNKKRKSQRREKKTARPKRATPQPLGPRRAPSGKTTGPSPFSPHHPSLPPSPPLGPRPPRPLIPLSPPPSPPTWVHDTCDTLSSPRAQPSRVSSATGSGRLSPTRHAPDGLRLQCCRVGQLEEVLDSVRGRENGRSGTAKRCGARARGRGQEACDQRDHQRRCAHCSTRRREKSRPVESGNRCNADGGAASGGPAGRDRGRQDKRRAGALRVERARRRSGARRKRAGHSACRQTRERAINSAVDDLDPLPARASPGGGKGLTWRGPSSCCSARRRRPMMPFDPIPGSPSDLRRGVSRPDRRGASARNATSRGRSRLAARPRELWEGEREESRKARMMVAAAHSYQQQCPCMHQICAASDGKTACTLVPGKT